MNKLFFLINTILISSLSLFSQEKYEREYRLKEEFVPESSKSFIKKVGFTEKIKWYKEEGLVSNSIEAKFKHNRIKYSIEFDSTGLIEDVEYVIPFQDIADETRIKIEQNLDSIYSKKKIQKVQIQLSGKEDLLVKALKEEKTDSGVKKKYELVVKGKTMNGYEMVEYLFSTEGNVERRSKIILKSTDNLEY